MVDSNDTVNVANQVSAFAAEMLVKWEKGAAEHGTVMAADPLAEAMAECVDLANYAMTSWYRLHTIRTKVGSLRYTDVYGDAGNREGKLK